MKATTHNGRSGQHGVYNPKHNDRSFNVGNSDHIDAERERHNLYWDCVQGLRDPRQPQEDYRSFESIEQDFYRLVYHNSVEAQNERNEKARHPERNRTTDDLLHDKRTCPEETLLQIGNIDESVDGETLAMICCDYFAELERRFGDHFHILDWALHVDESTPHIHERHVFDADDGHGFLKPQQEKALELLGIDLPDPKQKPGKQNNRKMAFDKICRDLFLEICESYRLHPDRDPSYGGRSYMEKQDYIIESQRQRLAKLEAEVAEKTLKLQDVDAIVDEVSEAAYAKACEVVTETVCTETTKAVIGEIEKYQRQETAPERKHSEAVKSVIGKCLTAVKATIEKAAGRILGRIRNHLQSPEIREANTNEVRAVTRDSVMAQLAAYRIQVEKNKNNNSSKEAKQLEPEK